MAALYTLLLSSLVLSCNILCGRVFGDDMNDESKAISEWRDPRDIVNYDSATAKMENSEVSAVSFSHFFCINVTNLICFFSNCHQIQLEVFAPKMLQNVCL